MKIVRNRIFETNSSSTHSLIRTNSLKEDYTPKNPTLLVSFIDTNDEFRLSSLQEKVSYLVSHIINDYKYNVSTYEDLISQVQNDWNFKRLFSYVKEHYNKEIIFPKEYKTYTEIDDDFAYENALEDIVSINHQLVERDFDELLRNIVCDYHDLLDDVLSPSTVIEIGHD